MLTELGQAQVEVQRCSLSSEGPNNPHLAGGEKKGRLNGFKRNTTAHVFFLKDGIGCRNLCTRKMYGII